MNICIKKIDKENASDANIPNEPFEIHGKMIPSLSDGIWTYEVEKFEEVTEMCFPDYPYDLENDDAIFFGAYDDDKCIGVAVYRKEMFKYLYLDDLKVNKAYRGMKIGGKLIEAGMDYAKANNMQGVYTIGQDNNLSACMFYLKQGFEIGGFDNRSYRGTSQQDKADIYFYKDC